MLALFVSALIPTRAAADITDQITFVQCDISGKVSANNSGIVSYQLNGACTMNMGPEEAFNDGFKAQATWNPQTKTATEHYVFWDGRTVDSISTCLSNPWVQATSCAPKSINQSIPISGIVLPPYPLSAFLMDAAQHSKMGNKTKEALAHPSSAPPPPPPPPPPPTAEAPGCKHFLGRPMQLICMTDAGQAACVLLRKQKKADSCLRAGAKEQDLFAVGCTNFFGRADEQLCNSPLAFKYCEKARAAGKMKVCLLKEHPEAGLPSLGCTSSGPGVWTCPTTRGFNECEGAKKKNLTKSCTKQ